MKRPYTLHLANDEGICIYCNSNVRDQRLATNYKVFYVIHDDIYKEYMNKQKYGWVPCIIPKCPRKREELGLS